MRLLPKASGFFFFVVFFNRASTASMGIVFPAPHNGQINCGSTFSSSPAPFYSHPAQTLLGLSRGGKAREKAHAFTSASHTHTQSQRGGEKKSNCSDMHACAHARMPAHRHMHAHVISFREGQQWERVKRRKMVKSLAAGRETPSV